MTPAHDVWATRRIAAPPEGVPHEGKRTTAPSFGKTSAATINAAATGEMLALVADLFGANLGTAVLPVTSDPAGAECQAAILKGASKLTATHVKQFLARNVQ